MSLADQNRMRSIHTRNTKNFAAYRLEQYGVSRKTARMIADRLTLDLARRLLDELKPQEAKGD